MGTLLGYEEVAYVQSLGYGLFADTAFRNAPLLPLWVLDDLDQLSCTNDFQKGHVICVVVKVHQTTTI